MAARGGGRKAGRWETGGARAGRGIIAAVAGVGAVALALGIGIGIGTAIWAGGDDDGDDASEAAQAAEAVDEEAGGDGSGDSSSDAGQDGGGGGATADDRQTGPPVRADDDDGRPAVLEEDVEPRVVGSRSGGATERTYTWHYDIPASNTVLLKAFRCPSEAPWVKWDGSVRSTLVGELTTHVADVHVDASEGTGYGAFRDPAVKEEKHRYYMTGWTEGTVFRNNIWAPVFTSGTADVRVTCTSDQDDAAWHYVVTTLRDLFPWA